MEKQKLCQSLIKWIRTFNIQAPHGTVDDLSDGVAMAQVLAQVAPDWFDSFWLSKLKFDDVSNWRLKVSNLKKILKGIQDYYQEVIGQQLTDFNFPDLNSIAENNDAAELGRLLQLILGCAVNCDHKQEYIEVIMDMEEADQHEVMNAIQELMMTSSGVATIDVAADVDQTKRLTEQLQSAVEAKDHITQRCHELDMQVAVLQEDKTTLETENEKLSRKLAQLEGLDDISLSAGRNQKKLQLQVDHLQEEMYKLETARDEYRMKCEDFEKRLADTQLKNEEMQKKIDDARVLKDEVDILRETADKALKMESTIESYKKKLEDMSDLKRQIKILEEKNVEYMQNNMQLEDDLKKGNSLKSRIDVYKKQIFELHNKVLEETKRGDAAEFENKRTQDKLVTLQKEKERIIAEKDAMKETVDELKLSLLEIENSKKLGGPGESSNVGSDSEMLDSVPPEIKEKLIRLQHENKMLKLNAQSNNEELLQCMLEDSRQHENKLQSENRLANQRILELQGQLEDLQSGQSEEMRKSNASGSEIGQKLSAMMAKQTALEEELVKKNAQCTELETQLHDRDQKLQAVLDTLNKKEDDMRCMEERYKKYLEKAKCVIRTLDPKINSDVPNFQITMLKTQLQEKEKMIEALEKESERVNAQREIEERLITSSFHYLGQQLQRKAAEERLASTQIGQTFLARQRQATSRKLGTGLTQR